MNNPRKLTSYEIKRNCLTAFGPSLGPVVYELDKEVAWMCAKWKQHRILFDEKTVPLLQNTAHNFFMMVNIVFVYDVILSLTRLTDPSKQGGKRNLSLYSLIDHIDEQPLQTKINTRIEEAVKQTTVARDWRNKHIAHRTFPNFSDSKFDPLPELTLESIKSAVRAVCDVLVFLYQEKMNKRMFLKTQLFAMMLPLL